MPNVIKFNDDYPVIAESDKLYERALGLIPSVTQTLAKGPGQYVKGVAPKYLKCGKGSHVWDVDGNEYIDYNMGIGPVSLGYCYEKVDDAIKEQLKNGITFSMMHPLEVEAAELLSSVIPNGESIRFTKSGAEATSAAIRVARAFTGRDKVLCCGYHGWHDWYIGTTSRDAGIPDIIKELTYTFDYNNIDSLTGAIDGDTACVILEPALFEKPSEKFFSELKEICVRNGTLLIFDEMWTGFRYAPGGAQELFNVKADLACYSKAVANGMPIGILAGRRDVMQVLEKEVFFYSTFGGETLSLAAVIATVKELHEKKVSNYMYSQGKKIKDAYNKIASTLGIEFTKCTGFDCRTIVTFDALAGDPLELKSFVQQELFKRGILWAGFHNICYSHSDTDIEYTIAAYEDILPLLKIAVEEGSIRLWLKGETLEPVFRKTSNFNTKPKNKKK